MKLRDILEAEELCSTKCCGPKPVSKCHCGPECPHCDCHAKNKAKKDVKEGVLAFPQEKRKRQVNMDKLRKHSSMYDELTGLPTDKHPENREPEYWLVDDNGKGYAQANTEKELMQRKPEIEMKSGVRGLRVIPIHK